MFICSNLSINRSLSGDQVLQGIGKQIYHSTISSFYHIRLRLAQNIARYYTVELSKNTDGKWSNKMPGLNDPNFD